jgi:4-hydroxy 2-oxovalerate aldolase
MGISTGVDLFKTMKIGEDLIRPLMPIKSGVTALDITMGLAQFHSSFLPRIERAAAEFGVDPKLLIVEVSRVDRINPAEELIAKTAARLAGPASQDAMTRT